MTTDSQTPAILRPPTTGDLLVIVGYTALIVGTVTIGVALGDPETGRPVARSVVPWSHLLLGLLVVAPPVVAAWNCHRGGTVVGSLAVGLVPGVAFELTAILGSFLVTSPPGEGAPSWVLAVMFGAFGLVGAAAGTLCYLATDWVHRSLA